MERGALPADQVPRSRPRSTGGSASGNYPLVSSARDVMASLLPHCIFQAQGTAEARHPLPLPVPAWPAAAHCPGPRPLCPGHPKGMCDERLNFCRPGAHTHMHATSGKSPTWLENAVHLHDWRCQGLCGGEGRQGVRGGGDPGKRGVRRAERLLCTPAPQGHHHEPLR